MRECVRTEGRNEKLLCTGSYVVVCLNKMHTEAISHQDSARKTPQSQEDTTMSSGVPGVQDN